MIDETIMNELAAAEYAKAIALAQAAQEYANAHKLAATAKSHKRYQLQVSAEIALLALHNAAIAFVEDGDFYTARQVLCDDNGWDVEGYPVDEQGNRTGDERFLTFCDRG